MKQGITLQELAAEITRQQNAKADYLADTGAMSMVESENGLSFELEGRDNGFKINDNAHSQIGQHLGIPAKYYAKMQAESPELLTQNVNHWLHSQTSQRMLRTLDGNLRAFLSDRYRRVDNDEIAETVLPIIAGMKTAQVKSCQITETRMYIKVVNPRIQAEVKVGDIVQSGVIISNSEVGCGSVSISPLIYRLACTNGMVAQDSGVRKYHIGRANDADMDMGIFKDETIEADDRAFLLKVRDAVTAAADQTAFNRIVRQMRDATEAKIEPIAAPKVVELTSKQYGMTISEGEGILGHLIEGGDLSLYGVANAITRYAQDVNSYDRSTELEATGYKVLTMAPGAWKDIQQRAGKEVSV